MAEENLHRRVVLDTGPLVAIYCEVDEHHEICTQTLTRIVPPMLTTWPVITEAAWILRDQLKALERLYQPKGLFTLVQQHDATLYNIHAMAKRYRSLKPQLADLSLVCLADQMGLVTVFTLDRRDFGVYRSKGRRFRLLPEM